MSHQFKRGEFQTFRATTKVHLGPIEQDVYEDDLIDFDGQTAIIGGQEHQISTIRSAIKAGWFVPETDTTSKYVPKAAQMSLRPAQAAGQESRGEPIKVHTVQDEERNVGSLEEVRADRKAAAAKQEWVRGTPRVSADADDGVAVARIKTPAKQKTEVKDGSATARAISALDNKPPPKAIVTASGDVEEAIVGDDLQELLPNAISSQVPKPGPAGEGDQPHLTAEEKAEAAKAARKASLAASTPNISAEVAEDAPLTPSDLALLNAKISGIRALIPNFEWDMTVQWRRRAKMAVEQHGDDPSYMNGIMAIETDSVKKLIQSKLG